MVFLTKNQQHNFSQLLVPSSFILSQCLLPQLTPTHHSPCNHITMQMQMLIIAVLYSLTLVRIIESRSWDDLLQADITCCNTVTDEDECEATYGGSSCVWLEWGINDDVDNIITQSGSQCVGSDYYYCRIETDDCCAPGCDDNSEGSTTSSPARWPTPEPTRVCNAICD